MADKQNLGGQHLNAAIISVDALVKGLGVTALVRGKGSIDFTSAEINRPGLQFTGYYEHFSAERVQVLGNAETHYIYSLTEDDLIARMERFMSFNIPCIVCTRSNRPPRALLEAAEHHGVPVFISDMLTDTISHRINSYVGRQLAPKICVHGVLLDVFGIGILLTGESGMGKSETALEMIKEGHRLVADDVVEITRVAPDRVTGCAPEPIRHLMEVRGIGIIDVRYLYGVGAVIPEKTIDLIMELEMWHDESEYERVGVDERQTELLDVKIPSTRIPVRPGRNLAVIIEAAARNFRLRRMGYDAAGSFAKAFDELKSNNINLF